MKDASITSYPNYVILLKWKVGTTLIVDQIGGEVGHWLLGTVSGLNKRWYSSLYN
jgi:hypothetical protein